MFVVDTNILIYAADRDSLEHDACRTLLLRWQREPMPWYLTWSIVYEFMRVTTHPRVFRKPLKGVDAWQFLEAILAAPNVEMLVETQRHANILKGLLREHSVVRGNLIFDAHVAALMYEHGIKTIYTRDADFNRFRGLEVIDPL